MAIQFSGLSSGLPTEQLIQLMLDQESMPITRLQNRQDMNAVKKNAISSIKTTLMALATSITALNSSSVNKRTVTSSDSNAISATGNGSATGSYDMVVKQLATSARLETTKGISSPYDDIGSGPKVRLETNKSFDSANATVGNNGDTYTIVGKNGAERTITLTEETSLADLASAINAESGSTGVSAEIVQKNGKSQLVLNAENNGSGEFGIVGSNPENALGVGTNSTELSKGVKTGTAGATYTIIGKDGTATEFNLKAGETSLADLSKAINAKTEDTGVSASLVQKKPGEYILVLSATESGKGEGGGDRIGIYGEAGNALGVAENETDALTHSNVSYTSAHNALFTLNGVDLERTSNVVDNAIDGMTFTLKQADPSKTVTLASALDKDSITKSYQEVIDKFNAAYKAYKDASGNGGPLSGDMIMQTMFTQLRSAISVSIESPGGGGTLKGSSAGLGLTTNRDGTISLDAKKLSEALDADPELVGQIFQKASSATTSLIDRMTLGNNGTLNTIINNIDSQNNTMSRQIDNLLARLDRRKEILTAQFARLETVIGQLQAAGQSLGGLSY
jgi:flagellar hook-associated protein 2